MDDSRGRFLLPNRFRTPFTFHTWHFQCQKVHFTLSTAVYFVNRVPGERIILNQVSPTQGRARLSAETPPRFITYLPLSTHNAMATLNTSCHCQAIRLTFPTPTTALNECQCSICRRYGALWSYYPLDSVTITLKEPGVAETYVWRNERSAFTRCKECGCMTHWAPLKGQNRMGVNCRMLERDELDKLEKKKSEGPE